MGIPPIAEFRIQSHVLPSNIEAPHKSRPAVNHHNLPVVPVIHAELQPPEKSRKKLSHLDAGAPQPLPVPFFHGAASHAVIQQAHFHTLLHLLNQKLLKGLPQLVVAYNVVLDMNIRLRLADLLVESGKLFLSVRVNLNLVVRAVDGIRRLQIHQHHIRKFLQSGIRRLKFLPDNRLLLFADGRIDGVLNLLRTEDMLPVKVMSHHKIEKNSQNRNKIQEKQPCPDGFRLPAFKKNNQNRQDNVDKKQMVHPES